MTEKLGEYFPSNNYVVPKNQKQQQDKQLQDVISHKSDITFEEQAEKKMQVYEAATRLNFAAWMEWMADKRYFITKG